MTDQKSHIVIWNTDGPKGCSSILKEMVYSMSAYTLPKEEVFRYADQGYLGPFTLCSPEEMDVIRKRIEEEVLITEPPFNSTVNESKFQSRHLDRRVVYDLCTHPAVVDRMAGILGENLVLWRSNFFKKDPGTGAIPWHQDANYWPIEPPLNISAWIAIDEAVVENSCVQVIPGSHRKVVPHIVKEGEKGFLTRSEEADPRYVDADKAIPMELKPGQFFIFNERLLHYSAPNTSTKRRLGLAVRVTVPFVKVYHEQIFDGHKVIVVKGNDAMGLNDTTEPPML